MVKHLVDTLKILKKGRLDLLQSYTEKNSDRYHYSFKYNDSPVARSIASSLLDHQWLDQQIEYVFSLYYEDAISKECLKSFLNTIKRFSIFESKDVFIGYDELVKTKIGGLKVLLDGCDRMNQKLHSIEFDICRDKVLFEREMERYAKETENHSEC